jgi:hypothetical protein
MTHRGVLPITSVPCGGYKRPIELPHLETFPGAACCQPIKLPSYKAAPLQAFGSTSTRGVSNRPPDRSLAQLGHQSHCTVRIEDEDDYEHAHTPIRRPSPV